MFCQARGRQGCRFRLSWSGSPSAVALLVKNMYVHDGCTANSIQSVYYGLKTLHTIIRTYGCDISSERLSALPITTITLMPSLLGLTILHLTLIRMLRRVKDIDRPLASNRPLDDDRQISPYGLWHGNEDTGIVKILLVLWPAGAFLVALLSSRALLQSEAGDEEKQYG